MGAALVPLFPESADAATVTLVGSKSCYRFGDTLLLSGSGFTPNGEVDITLDGQGAGTADTDAAGEFGVPFSVGMLRGVKRRTLIATDSTNPANVGRARFLGSALDVTVKPKDGAARRRLRIKASGFTTGEHLYAHILRKRYRRTVLIAKLKGPCRTLTVKKRVLPRSTRAGVYTVQFDTRRRYLNKTKVSVRFTVTVFPRAGGASVAGAASLFGQPRLTQTVLFSR